MATTKKYGSYGHKKLAQSRAKGMRAKGIYSSVTVKKDSKSKVQGYGQSYTVYGEY